MTNWGTAIVMSWNRLTGENVIRWRGTDISNVPIVASITKARQIEPGDIVGLIFLGDPAAAHIIGRIVPFGNRAEGRT